jgi:D-lactate dehydrogenase (cytochrome)
MPHDCSFVSELLPADRVSFADADREEHAADWWAGEVGLGVVPDVVVWPTSTEEVAAVIRAANDHDVPVTPWAAGTSVEGNAVPEFEGITMDLTRMDAILDVRPDDFQVDVEPGVIGSAVNEAVADHGLVFPSMPSSADLSTIGGMIANDASGQQTVKYGEVGDWVLGLEVVTGEGEIMTCGSRAVKSSSGYNLVDLMVGSEGTLGVVTRATLRLDGIPEQQRGGRAVFADLDDASEAIYDAVRSGVDVAKIELIDALSARMANAHLDTGLPDAPMIFVEFHADHGIDEEVAFCRTIFEAHDVVEFEVGDGASAAELWEIRDELGFAVQAYDPDLTPMHPGDVTVPISEYPPLVRYAKELGEEHDLLVPTFGHAGDGNLHYTAMVDQSDDAMVERGERVYEAVVERALEVGGTCTGEHGIGMGKQGFLEREHGAVAVEQMRRIKQAFDPNDVLNPGKLFPETAEGGRVRFAER